MRFCVRAVLLCTCCQKQQDIFFVFPQISFRIFFTITLCVWAMWMCMCGSMLFNFPFVYSMKYCKTLGFLTTKKQRWRKMNLLSRKIFTTTALSSSLSFSLFHLHRLWQSDYGLFRSTFKYIFTHKLCATVFVLSDGLRGFRLL